MSTQPHFSLDATELSASLTVRNLLESLAWYRDVLGFEVTKVHEREGRVVAASLKAGHVRVLLSQDDGLKGLDRLLGEGFSLQLTTRQSIDELADRIRSQAGMLDLEPTDMPWGTRAFRFRDPDGYRFTITSPSAERP